MEATTLRTSLPVQVVFVTLLSTCLGMVVWWVIDHSRYSEEMTREVVGLYADEAEVADVLMRTHGLTRAEIRELLPAVEVAPDGTTDVDGARRAELADDLASRRRRYFWEGGFFVVVLGATVALIGVTLRQRTELLRRQQNFLAAVSHELKSPLASLKLSAETLILRDPDVDGRRKLADRMVQSIERLNTMVSNLLNAARLDKGQVQLEPERLVLAELAARTTAPLLELGAPSGATLEVDVPADLVVHADPTATQLVLVNLVDNALKSVRAQGGGVVRLSACRDGQHVKLTVADDGLGFEPAEAERLFDEFYRAGSELRRRTKGVGLGLHIARSFVALDGGTIRAHSDGPGAGATFTVWWPAVEEARHG